jgi:thioester reductase-like protein
VLITGVTGLIGGELARRLLRCEVGKISCLIRPNPMVDVRSRLIERMQFSEDNRAARWGESLGSVTGDVVAPRFGLSDHDDAQVTESVDMIIHCASELSFVRDARCRETNVTGMHNLIALARRCRRNPLIVHLSTAFSCGAVTHQCLGEDDGSDPDNGHHNEYTRSKAMAERVLRDSRESCLILRPSITLSAGIPARKFARAIAWFVPLLREFEAIPIDPASRVDIVPVSFVADSIIRLLRKPQLRHDVVQSPLEHDEQRFAGVPLEAFGHAEVYFKLALEHSVVAFHLLLLTQADSVVARFASAPRVHSWRMATPLTLHGTLRRLAARPFEHQLNPFSTAEATDRPYITSHTLFIPPLSVFFIPLYCLI